MLIVILLVVLVLVLMCWALVVWVRLVWRRVRSLPVVPVVWALVPVASGPVVLAVLGQVGPLVVVFLVVLGLWGARLVLVVPPVVRVVPVGVRVRVRLVG
jgi:hypothetical protein